ncbi:hypothetical protein GCM10007881_55070 [Mesorhizobium huakuii]|nr:hypothetical protein GCM10007881_55070 [Mesorhizobium huakuii]
MIEQKDFVIVAELVIAYELEPIAVRTNVEPYVFTDDNVVDSRPDRNFRRLGKIAIGDEDDRFYERSQLAQKEEYVPVNNTGFIVEEENCSTAHPRPSQNQIHTAWGPRLPLEPVGRNIFPCHDAIALAEP